MKSIKKYIACFIIFLLLTSCENEIVGILNGTWSIDEISYQGNDVSHCLSLNVFYVKGNDLEFPQNICDESEMKNPLNNDNLSLEVFKKEKIWSIRLLNSKSILPVEEFSCKFIRNDIDKLLMMELSSQSVYILARKGFFDFDHNLIKIDRLVNLTKENE